MLRPMSTSFRRDLARRLLQIAIIAAPAGSSAGCLTSGSCDEPPPGTALGSPVQVCGAQSGAPDASTEVNGCPTGSDAEALVLESSAPFESQTFNFTIVSGPVNKSGKCCYVVQPLVERCIGGRPFLVEDRALVAPPRPGASSWSDAELPLPQTADLPAEVRAELAEAWTQDGLAEHASVASFARFSLELLAAGAPTDLVELAHRAALDEVRHARLCLSLAGAYAGAPVGPGAFPFAGRDGRVEVMSDLASIAARAAREGCVGETLAAVHAAEQLARATDPAVRAALEIIAADEARHAELAWRTVVWAVRTGGAPVRAAVAAVLENLDGDEGAAPRREGRLDRHGRLEHEEQRRLAARAIVEVVRPAARALLGCEVGGGERRRASTLSKTLS